MGVLTQGSVQVGRGCCDESVRSHHNWDGRSEGQSSEGSPLG